MREFFRGLGKFVRGLLNKIRKSKKREYESVSSIFGTIDTGTKEFSKIDDNGLVMIPSQANVNFELVYDEDNLINELEKFVSIHRTLLPKRYWVKTLIVTLAANQSSDYQAVDLSQYKNGIAHFIVGRTTDLKEIMDEYKSEEEAKEDEEWFAEELEQARESGMLSSVVGAATLLHYEELDIWSFELEGEDE